VPGVVLAPALPADGLWLMPHGLRAFPACSFAWAVAESALIFSGLCYNGRTPEVRMLWIAHCLASQQSTLGLYQL